MKRKIEQHHIDFAKRRRMDSMLVLRTPMLDEAAEWEDLVHRGVYDVYTARRCFIEKYPETNTISCICKRRNCRHTCKFSVLSLITDKPRKNK